MKKPVILAVVLILAIAGLYLLSPVFKNSVAGNSAKAPAAPVPKVVAHNNAVFNFEYPDRWHAYDRSASSTILLKTAEFPDIASELYALGEQIYVYEVWLVGEYEKPLSAEEYIAIVSESDNMYEGKPTLVRQETVNGQAVTRIEHQNKDLQHTLTYYVTRGKKLYALNLYPYDIDTAEGLQRYDDFMSVVNSFRFAE
jgi:hypothetical protein